MHFKRNRQPEQPAGRRRPGQVADQGRTFSYYAARSQGDFNVGRLARADQPVRKQPRLVQRIVVGHKRAVLVIIVLSIAALYNLQLSTTPRVVALTETADAPFLQDTTVYQAAAQQLLQQSATNRNKLTVNAPAVASQLKTKFPELRDVTLSLPFIGGQPVLYVQPSSPAAILSGTGGSFVLDENGRALLAVNAATDTARFKVPLVVDQSRLDIKPGQTAIPRGTAGFISTVVAQLQSDKVPIGRIVLPADGNTLNVFVANKPYYIKFNLRDSRAEAAQLQAGTYAAINQQLSSQSITPASYIDVRVPGRAYYK